MLLDHHDFSWRAKWRFFRSSWFWSNFSDFSESIVIIFFPLLQELQALIDEANQSLEESGTPSHEIMVIVLHREFAAGSVGITLAGGADYESKEITVRLHFWFRI